MFLEILQTLIKVLLVFSILIIAFGLAFYILLSGVSRIGKRIFDLEQEVRKRNNDEFSLGISFVVQHGPDVSHENFCHDVGRN